MQLFRQLQEGIMRVIGSILLLLSLTALSGQIYAVDAASPSAASKTEQLIADTYVRLEALNQQGADVGRYQMAKALALLDTARREHYMRNSSVIVREFIASAQGISSALEEQRVAGTDNPVYSDSKPVSPVLWQRVERLKSQLNFACTGALVAKAEVALLAAANDNYALGWQAAVARITLAEQWLNEAEQVGAC